MTLDRSQILIFVIVGALGFIATFFITTTSSRQDPSVAETQSPSAVPSPDSTGNRAETEEFIPITTLPTQLEQYSRYTFTDPSIDISFEYYPFLFIQPQAEQGEQPYTVVFRNYKPHPEDDRDGFNDQIYGENNMVITLTAYQNNDDLTLDEFFKRRYDVESIDPTQSQYELIKDQFEDTSIASAPALMHEGPFGREDPLKTVFFRHNGKIYQFTLMGGYGTGDTYSDQAEVIFDSMLETVRLL